MKRVENVRKCRKRCKVFLQDVRF